MIYELYMPILKYRLFKKIDEELKKRFKKTVKFSNNVLNLHACRKSL